MAATGNDRIEIIVHDDAVRALLPLDDAQLELMAEALEVARPHLNVDSDALADLHRRVVQAMYMIRSESGL